MPLLKANDFWKPNTYYYATERYKSLIENNNTLYICNESHLSQGEFDVSKFVGISGSGGLVPSGTWDIANSTAIGDDIEQRLQLTIPYASNIFNLYSAVSNGSTEYEWNGGVYFFGASTNNTVINNFTTTKWLGVAGNLVILTISQSDIIDLYNQTIMPSNTLYVSFFALFGQINVTIYTEAGTIVNDQFNNVVGDSTFIGINEALGKVYIENGVNSLEYDVDFDFNGLTDLKVGVGQLFADNLITATPITLVDTTLYGKPPITMLAPEIIVSSPNGAIDGSVWELVSNGDYDNRNVKSGDYAIFYNNLSEIVVIENNQNELETINNTLDDLVAHKVSMSDRCLYRGIIDDIGTDLDPVGKPFLHTVLRYGIIDPDDNGKIYVFDGNAFILVTVPTNAEFTIALTNYSVVKVNAVQKRYKLVQYNTNILSPLTDFLQDTTTWELRINSTDSRANTVIVPSEIDNTTLSINLVENDDYSIFLADEYPTYTLELATILQETGYETAPRVVKYITVYNTDINEKSITLFHLNAYNQIWYGRRLQNRTLHIAPKQFVTLKIGISNSIYTSAVEVSLAEGSMVTSEAFTTDGLNLDLKPNVTDVYLTVDQLGAFSITSTVDRLLDGDYVNLHIVQPGVVEITVIITDGTNTLSTVVNLTGSDKFKKIINIGGSLISC